ncbi:hypothetical protein NEUTE1DRAFT_115715 [Neurospora tetrasperma FGSC 2508]|uniref:peptidylprolyl isomerase n=1 Tax=Neurospora tetrasperma (strain FGSC 2508 / ATCC MYA-4615 / P0657) TaxID=510951 RepID=F8MCB3_NEUT8|nr:uncharacterized protein NEUTE1DRAFT_115715 [Neurospora tetrasperma FGSC 2508]EGO60414.1 hypothetical protein NEUTE1DRAFT_115715 [Neurospora tetrasperma FGSC 2508]EGZ75609.1 hypothetical protein NEUTE2DRAFT_143767 [Neurospora tetrasperma FGSC 2509]
MNGIKLAPHRLRVVAPRLSLLRPSFLFSVPKTLNSFPYTTPQTNSKHNFTTTSSKMTIPQLDGLQIEVQQEGQGTRETRRGDNVDVHYKGVLTSGKKFDASYDRGEPLNFTVGQGQVIKGWDEGLLGMKIGEKRKLTIAPHLAYGNRAVGGIIPANSTLIFETELVGIKGVQKGE